MTEPLPEPTTATVDPIDEAAAEGTTSVVLYAYRVDLVTLVFQCPGCRTITPKRPQHLVGQTVECPECAVALEYRGWRIDEETPTRPDERPKPVCELCGLEFTPHRDGSSTHDGETGPDQDADHVPRMY